MVWLMFLGGLLLLVGGAELLVRGASRLAMAWGISPLVVGLTVVAFGTSAPELAISVRAALAGQGAMAIGNVVGSNIFNVLFILGMAALMSPLVVAERVVRLEVPLTVALSALVLWFARDGRLDTVEGGVLLAGLAGYVVFSVVQSRRASAVSMTVDDGDSAAPRSADVPTSWIRNTALSLAGLAMLALGANWLVAAAVTAAEFFGVSELVIGLTIVAAGTGLPELVTSVIASLRGQRDIAVGNVIGSNLFNLMGVLGAASVAAPGGLEVPPEAFHFDLPIMLVVTFACLPIFFTGGLISRAEGGLLLAYYIAYTLYLLLAASHHAALAVFSEVMLYFAIPLTLITLAVLATQAWRRARR